MSPEEFAFICTLLKKRSGFVVQEDKRYLVESRLKPVAEKAGFASLSELVQALRKPGSERLAQQVTEAMTINESFFFRDKSPFENFRNVMLPHFLKARASEKRLRIWSAAASTGQEAYSLAMEVCEQGTKLAGWRIDSLGTDLSSEAIQRAKEGLYTQFEVQRGMPVQLLVKYFKQEGNLWRIDARIRNMVQYRTFNLLDDFRSLGQFDIVFCRNVLIYFDRETKSDILNRIARQMPEDGFLVLGGAESVLGLSKAFKTVPGIRGLYQRAPEVGVTAPVSSAGLSRPIAPSKPATATASRPAVALGGTGGLASRRLAAAGRNRP